MKRYKILESKSVYDLTKKVEEYMRDGWQPQGGICVYMKPSGILGPDE